MDGAGNMGSSCICIGQLLLGTGEQNFSEYDLVLHLAETIAINAWWSRWNVNISLFGYHKAFASTVWYLTDFLGGM